MSHRSLSPGCRFSLVCGTCPAVPLPPPVSSRSRSGVRRAVRGTLEVSQKPELAGSRVGYCDIQLGQGSWSA